MDSGIQIHGCAIIWIMCSFIIISALNHMGALGVAYGGGGQLVSQNVGICSTSLGWPRMHPGMSGRVPGGSKQILDLINAIVLNVCSCNFVVVFWRYETGHDKLLDIINAIVLNVCSCCVLLCFVLWIWPLDCLLPIAYCIAYCPGVDYYCLFAPGVELLLVSIRYYMFMPTLMLKPRNVATYIM